MEGNLFAEEGVSFGSNDTRLEIEQENGFEQVTEGMEIAGQYGTLILNPDGSYTYTANPSLDNLGSIEQFTYQVVNDDGDSETATLSIRLDSNTESVIWGTDGDDTVNGSDGNDVIIGGAGDDTLFGGDGADTFKWNLGDEGEVGGAAVDTVMDFNTEEGDKLDIADLLQGENEGNIGSYIFAEQEGDNTVLHISSDGTLGENGEGADQKIILKNVDMGSNQES